LSEQKEEDVERDRKGDQEHSGDTIDAQLSATVGDATRPG
jgi:hypothetical protein